MIILFYSQNCQGDLRNGSWEVVPPTAPQIALVICITHQRVCDRGIYLREITQGDEDYHLFKCFLSHHAPEKSRILGVKICEADFFQSVCKLKSCSPWGAISAGLSADRHELMLVQERS